jgi:hypothetical protein
MRRRRREGNNTPKKKRHSMEDLVGNEEMIPSS